MSIAMCPQKAKLIIGRLENILSAVRFQNSGADVHMVGNIQNVASMLKQQLEEDHEKFDEITAERIVKNTERRLIDFYKKKYF